MSQTNFTKGISGSFISSAEQSWSHCGWTIFEYESLASTNGSASQFLSEIEDHSLILAHSQTQGRGRLQRQWLSPRAGNLYLSFVLKRGLKSAERPNLSQVAALSVADTLSLNNLPAKIKWPNDVQVKGKKICGILAEGAHDKEPAAIIGIGLNVNMPAELLATIDIPATSLTVELSHPLDEKKVCMQLIEAFDYRLGIFLSEGFVSLLPDWKKYSELIGKTVTVSNGDRNGNATVLDLNANGTLQLRWNDDSVSNLITGDLAVQTKDD